LSIYNKGVKKVADTQKDTQPVKGKTTNAVVYVDGIPKWDVLSDEVSYALLLEQRGKEFIFVPVLRQHTDSQAKKGFAYANKVALRDAIPPMKMKGREYELPLADEKPYIDFVDDHFVRILGTSSDNVDEHKAYLDERPHLKVRIFREGVEGLEVKEAEEDEGPMDIFDISVGVGEDEIELDFIHDLFSPTKNRKERINITHKVREASEKEYQLWRKSSTRKFNPSKRKFTTQENYDVLEKIYNDLIVSVDGMVVDKKECSKGNKEDWVDLIPLEHKLLVLERVFQDYMGKN
jgi:hypothetical protein